MAGEVLACDVGETRSDAFAGEVGGLVYLAIVRHANRQSTIPDTQFEPVRQRGTTLGDQVAPSYSEIDGSLGTQDRNVVGPQEGDIDRHLADASEKASVLPSKAEPRFPKQLSRKVGQPPLAGDANTKVLGHGKSGRLGFLFSRGFFVQSGDTKSPGKFGFDFAERDLAGGQQHQHVVHQVARFANRMFPTPRRRAPRPLRPVRQLLR